MAATGQSSYSGRPAPGDANAETVLAPCEAAPPPGTTSEGDQPSRDQGAASTGHLAAAANEDDVSPRPWVKFGGFGAEDTADDGEVSHRRCDVLTPLASEGDQTTRDPGAAFLGHLEAAADDGDVSPRPPPCVRFGGLGPEFPSHGTYADEPFSDEPFHTQTPDDFHSA